MHLTSYIHSMWDYMLLDRSIQAALSGTQACAPRIMSVLVVIILGSLQSKLLDVRSMSVLSVTLLPTFKMG